MIISGKGGQPHSTNGTSLLLLMENSCVTLYIIMCRKCYNIINCIVIKVTLHALIRHWFVTAVHYSISVSVSTSLKR